ncbi:LamG domain-containing protein [Clostridium sp. JS66]|uniref:LamG domain-containing protein n=1 Tax=Clostridium sp. JS66 TaxID=3064705 RepID=UPI00298E0A6D|nr:LamG domain-containing protein [Clostridium sp. JS66]WPC42979.1 LamG domain-containing protein [Clostridium sp. JS66]
MTKCSLSFNGTNSVVSITNKSIYNTLTLTVECWIKTSVNDFTQRGIINKYVDSSANGWTVTLDGGKIQVYYYSTSANHINFIGTKNVADGVWHHIAFTVDSTGGKIYIDGVVDTSSTWTGTPSIPTSTTNINIGLYQGGSYYFNGLIDEVRIWNVARTQNDIKNNMKRSIIGNETGLIGYWQLDEGTGTTINDLTTNSNIGTITNAIWSSDGHPIIKYLIQDKNSNLYTYNGTSILNSLSQVLEDANFKSNGFDDPTLISESLWNSTFPDRTGLQLLEWTDDTSVTNSSMIYNTNSYKPYEKLNSQFDIKMWKSN